MESPTFVSWTLQTPNLWLATPRGFADLMQMKHKNMKQNTNIGISPYAFINAPWCLPFF